MSQLTEAQIITLEIKIVGENKMYKNKLVVMAFLLVLLSGLTIFGQGNPNGEIPLEEAQKLGRLPKDFQIDRMRRPPAGCPKNARAYVISRDATTGVARDENMNNFFRTFTREFQTRFPPRGYGEKGPDRWFGDSFPLGTCKICAATLTAQIENEGASNDSMLLFLSDNTLKMINGGQNTSGNRLLYLYTHGGTLPSLWSPTAPFGSAQNLTLDLNVNGDISSSASPNDGIKKINEYIFTTASEPALEVFFQDDTKVNSIQLLIWR